MSSFRKLLSLVGLTKQMYLLFVLAAVSGLADIIFFGSIGKLFVLALGADLNSSIDIGGLDIDFIEFFYGVLMIFAIRFCLSVSFVFAQKKFLTTLLMRLNSSLVSGVDSWAGKFSDGQANSGAIGRSAIEDLNATVEASVAASLLISEVCFIVFVIFIGLIYIPEITLFSAGYLGLVFVLINQSLHSRVVETAAQKSKYQAQFFELVLYIASNFKSVQHPVFKGLRNRASSAGAVVARAHSLNVFIGHFPRIVYEFFGIGLVLFGLYSLDGSIEEELDYIVIAGLLILRMLPSANRVLTSIQRLKYHKKSLCNIGSILEPSSGCSCAQGWFDFKFDKSMSISLHTGGICQSFTLKRGAVLLIKGSSGSGKSTLADQISGVTTPASGRLSVKTGFESFDMSRSRPTADDIFYVDQFSSFGNGPLLEELAIDLNRFKDRDDLVERVIDDLLEIGVAVSRAQCLEMLDRPVSSLTNHFSGGEINRLHVVRAFHTGATFLIFDEIDSSVDDASRDLLMSFIERRVAGHCILVISHHELTFDNCEITTWCL